MQDLAAHDSSCYWGKTINRPSFWWCPQKHGCSATEAEALAPAKQLTRLPSWVYIALASEILACILLPISCWICSCSCAKAAARHVGLTETKLVTAYCEGITWLHHCHSLGSSGPTSSEAQFPLPGEAAAAMPSRCSQGTARSQDQGLEQVYCLSEPDTASGMPVARPVRVRAGDLLLTSQVGDRVGTATARP